MFAHFHVQREPLSVRQRMSDMLSRLQQESFVQFHAFFLPEEGRMGVAVTFLAVLELLKEGLIDVVQAEEFGPIHITSAAAVTGAGKEPKSEVSQS